MEENQITPANTQNISQGSTKKINIWMIISVILIVAIIGIGAYMLGKKQNVSQPTPVVKSISPTSVPPSVTQTIVSPTITKPTASGKKVSAGIKNQFFSPYTVTVPVGWEDKHTSNTASDVLTLTKGQNTLTISQAAAGGGSCIFPGDTPEPMAQTFTSFVGITSTSSQFRRGMSQDGSYTVCEQKSGGYAFPTSYGYITYAVATPTDQSTLAEMDGIIASLSK